MTRRRAIDPPWWWKPWLHLHPVLEWWHRPRRAGKVNPRPDPSRRHRTAAPGTRQNPGAAAYPEATFP